jgi:RNA polymerase sigma factor (sigma-70 family)
VIQVPFFVVYLSEREWKAMHHLGPELIALLSSGFVRTVRMRYFPNAYGELAQLMEDTAVEYILKAAKRFDPTKGASLKTYMSRACWNAFQDSRKAFRSERKRRQNVIYLDAPVDNDEEGSSLHDVKLKIVSEHNDNHTYTDRAIEKLSMEDISSCQVDYAMKFLQTMDEKKRMVIEYAFGLNGRQKLSRVQIGEMFGMTPQGVSNIISRYCKAVRKKWEEEWQYECAC